MNTDITAEDMAAWREEWEQRTTVGVPPWQAERGIRLLNALAASQEQEAALVAAIYQALDELDTETPAMGFGVRLLHQALAHRSS